MGKPEAGMPPIDKRPRFSVNGWSTSRAPARAHITEPTGIGNAMIPIVSYPSPSAEKRLAAIAKRSVSFRKQDARTVTGILDAVRKDGDEALVSFTRRYDAPGFDASLIEVPRDAIKDASRHVGRPFKQALNRAVGQIETFHRRQLRKSWIDTDREGVLLGQLIRPVDSAGIYVPGGKGGETPLVSSVLMGAIPAKVCGVESLVMATPPTADGGVNPHLLAAADRVGIDRVFRMGSAWAIGAMAYGTATVPAVDVIVGPGNLYVTLAKKLVSGTVGIDMIAGPSEILIIADHAANPAFAAADMLSQAEHDPMASAVLITTDPSVADRTREALSIQIETLSRRAIAQESIQRFGVIFVVADLDGAADLANRMAPEHLELLVESPLDLLGSIRHAGAVFLGPYSPEPMGDYVAGPNHVLPTSGTARFSSALSVDNFIKKTSLIRYSRDAFRKEAPMVATLADIEGLTAHSAAVRRRLGSQEPK
jgi:histidinol dehydrogenase